MDGVPVAFAHGALPPGQAPMTSRKISNFFSAIAAVLVFGASSATFAQGPGIDAPVPSTEFVSPVVSNQPNYVTHKFLDKQNRLLFIAVAAINATDFSVTRSNLQSGGQELNPVVRVFGRSTPALAANFAGETIGAITFSYFFHKTGHHRLERLTSLIDIGSSAGAVAYGLTHR